MTLKEADEAAQKVLPIIHQIPGRPPTEYSRITQTGYKYDKNGHGRGFVQLFDKCRNSVTDANPEHCTVKEAIP